MSDFEKAVYYVRNAPADPNATNESKLAFYGLFKQATAGDNNTSQPWAIQLEARAKWDAWKACEGKSQDDAKRDYVALVAAANPNWLDSDVVKGYSA